MLNIDGSSGIDILLHTVEKIVKLWQRFRTEVGELFANDNDSVLGLDISWFWWRHLWYLRDALDLGRLAGSEKRTERRRFNRRGRGSGGQGLDVRLYVWWG